MHTAWTVSSLAVVGPPISVGTEGSYDDVHGVEELRAGAAAGGGAFRAGGAQEGMPCGVGCGVPCGVPCGGFRGGPWSAPCGGFRGIPPDGPRAVPGLKLRYSEF